MKAVSVIVPALIALAVASPLQTSNKALEKRGAPEGIDVDFTAVAPIPWSTLTPVQRFAYIQSTYGITVTNPLWNAQKDEARKYRFFTGGMHHPDPFVSTPASQAKFFSINGGDWVLDQRTFPGALYLEQNKYNKLGLCYGYSPASWVKWIDAFAKAYKSINTKYPVIFTTSQWWKECAGDYTGFGSIIDIWVINHTGGPMPPPTGWSMWKGYQYADSGDWNNNLFNGTPTDLANYAL